MFWRSYILGTIIIFQGQRTANFANQFQPRPQPQPQPPPPSAGRVVILSSFITAYELPRNYYSSMSRDVLHTHTSLPMSRCQHWMRQDSRHPPISSTKLSRSSTMCPLFCFLLLVLASVVRSSESLESKKIEMNTTVKASSPFRIVSVVRPSVHFRKLFEMP